MNDSTSKISTHQIFVIYALATASPIIRILSVFVSRISQRAAWISPVVSFIPIVLLIGCLHLLFKRNPDKGLQDIFVIVFGNFIGKTILTVYFLWILLLSSIYLRYFGENFLSSIAIYSPIQFFIIIILLLGLYISRKNIEFFARMVEFLAIIFVIVFCAVFIIAVPNINFSNLMPITTYDTIPTLKASTYIIAIWSYITIMMFLGRKISQKNELLKKGVKFSIILAISNVMILFITVGTLGYEITQNFTLPFFMALKSMHFLNILERFESFFITSWIMADFVLLVSLLYVLRTLSGDIFNIKQTKYILTPLAFILFTFSLYICENVFQLETFSFLFADIVNNILFFIIPFITLVIGKVRKVI